MQNSLTQVDASRQIDAAIAKFEEFEILASVAGNLLSKLNSMQFTPSMLTEFVESDPCLTVKVFRMLNSVSATPFNLVSARLAIEKLPLRQIREAVLSLPLTDHHNQQRSRIRSELTRNSIATALIAQQLAIASDKGIDAGKCWYAGLLHNIGNFAFEQIMPKSMEKMLLGNQDGISFASIQKQNLGIDYTLAGKRVARKWRLPDYIATSVWLHRIVNEQMFDTFPDSDIAAVVHLATAIAARENIGLSSCGYDDISIELASKLGISQDALGSIKISIGKEVESRERLLGLNVDDAFEKYCIGIKDTASGLAVENSRLQETIGKNLSLVTAGEFADHILSNVFTGEPCEEMALRCARIWKQLYQTGRTCVYFAQPDSTGMIKAALVGSQDAGEILSLNKSFDSSAFQFSGDHFKVSEVSDDFNWLFDQIEDFDITNSKAAPLLCKRNVIGVIVFEFRHPVSLELLSERVSKTAAMIGSLLAISSNAAQQEQFAERLTMSLSNGSEKILNTGIKEMKLPQVSQEEVSALLENHNGSFSSDNIASLAEMAAGAAHELNNPLAVISGRAQLLASKETDAEKKSSLELIHRNARELSDIVTDLLNFAEPPVPKSAPCHAGEIIRDAIELAASKTDQDHLNVQLKMADNTTELFADSAQVISALANVIQNAVESYSTQSGPIKIEVETNHENEMVSIAVSDLGCGMDEETVSMATNPFFSAKPAGRRRGTGLSHALRLVEQNNGTLAIRSELGKGTTVRISLPENL